MNFYKYILALLLFITIQTCSFAQGVEDWVHFQTIKIRPDTIHALTYDHGLLALNINNEIVDLYSLSKDEFAYDKSYEIKWVWEEFGTMRFMNGFLYLSIDGHKYYRIDYRKDKIRKTNTYKAGFYIMSRYDVEYRDDEWIFEISDSGNLEVYHNYAKKVKEEFLNSHDDIRSQQDNGAKK